MGCLEFTYESKMESFPYRGAADAYMMDNTKLILNSGHIIQLCFIINIEIVWLNPCSFRFLHCISDLSVYPKLIIPILYKRVFMPVYIHVHSCTISAIYLSLSAFLYLLSAMPSQQSAICYMSPLNAILRFLVFISFSVIHSKAG